MDKFQAILVNSWRPAVEIFLLAVIIYYILSFVQGTRGWSIVIGFIVVLLAPALVSQFLDLRVLGWLLTHFSVYFAVAVLVIFQPELRRMLAQLGNMQLFTTPRQQRENIEVIIQTCERLSEVRIGALIAFEQSINLREAVESGIPIECTATPEMFETIFFPNNAIHDGGVIMKGDRIAYAACIFPLTRRQNLSKSLGTRHRAAIGLTEETDAVVVAVSEETGAISYAYNGHLVRGVTVEALRAFLSSILIKPDKSRGVVDWWRQWRLNRVKPSAAVLPKTGVES
jgi:diadenylate cyclase